MYISLLTPKGDSPSSEAVFPLHVMQFLSDHSSPYTFSKGRVVSVLGPRAGSGSGSEMAHFPPLATPLSVKVGVAYRWKILICTWTQPLCHSSKQEMPLFSALHFSSRGSLEDGFPLSWLQSLLYAVPQIPSILMVLQEGLEGWNAAHLHHPSLENLLYMLVFYLASNGVERVVGFATPIFKSFVST